MAEARQEALDAFKYAVNKSGRKPEYLTEWIMCRIAYEPRRNWKELAELAGEVVKALPESPLGHLVLGFVYDFQGRAEADHRTQIKRLFAARQEYDNGLQKSG